MSDQTLTRDGVRAQLDSAYAAVRASVAGLGDAEMQAIAVTPEWSIADMLRHALSWDEHALRCLEDWHAPRDWVPEIARTDGNAYNAELVAVKETVEGSIVLDSIKSVYGRFKEMLDTRSDDVLASRGEPPWGGQLSQIELIADSFRHDEEHAAQIAAARSQDNSKEQHN